MFFCVESFDGHLLTIASAFFLVSPGSRRAHGHPGPCPTCRMAGAEVAALVWQAKGTSSATPSPGQEGRAVRLHCVALLTLPTRGLVLISDSKFSQFWFRTNFLLFQLLWA